jgi:phospholipase C
MSVNNASQKIQNIFVLMLENRSFDHMLGFSGITGIDAETGQNTQIEGLSGQESNLYDGESYQVTMPADYVMPFDPGHEFTDVVEQLAGAGAAYPAGGMYPPINNSGFVADYATTKSAGEGGATSNFGEIMKCYDPKQVPVMVALAQEFALCDNWFAAVPGPTWPNRFFLMAASSGGLDHSPTTGEIIQWETFDGFEFENGNLFNLVNQHTALGSRIYHGDIGPVAGSIPIASALKGINYTDTIPYSQFAQDIKQYSYPWPFTFIEPNYGDITNNSYQGGTSQHPMDDVRNGERLIKSTYEAIRNSPHWENSLLIITYDEHGGFYDHLVPPNTVAPGDNSQTSQYNQYGFTFEQLGVRVPAIIVSPFIPKNIIDHRVYEHSSVPATVEAILGLPHLTQRDATARDLTSLLSLSVARTDAPTILPDPPNDWVPESNSFALTNDDESLPQAGNLPGFLHAALKADLALSPSYEHSDIQLAFQNLKTKKDAADYIQTVKQKADNYHMMNS